MPVSGLFSKYAVITVKCKAAYTGHSLTERKGISDRKEKIDSVQGLITSLSQDIPILEIYKDMFPTNDMKQALTEFYIHTLDLLWRLSMYYSNNYFSKPTVKHGAQLVQVSVF